MPTWKWNKAPFHEKLSKSSQARKVYRNFIMRYLEFVGECPPSAAMPLYPGHQGSSFPPSSLIVEEEEEEEKQKAMMLPHYTRPNFSISGFLSPEKEKIGFFRPLTLHHQLIYRKKEEETSFSLPIWNARSSNSPFPRRRRRRWFYYSICATTKCVYFFKQPSCCAPEHGIRREEGLRTLEQTGTQFGGKEL